MQDEQKTEQKQIKKESQLTKMRIDPRKHTNSHTTIRIFLLKIRSAQSYMHWYDWFLTSKIVQNVQLLLFLFIFFKHRNAIVRKGLTRTTPNQLTSDSSNLINFRFKMNANLK